MLLFAIIFTLGLSFAPTVQANILDDITDAVVGYTKDLAERLSGGEVLADADVHANEPSQ
ncbi:MAG: hypothetical protein HRT36_04425 [Alphaproteobacteria bacterium]|nr:hypothetical protein [Alphaproteobacteria bacterium]